MANYAKARIADLEPAVADAITDWVDLVERKEIFGLWLWGAPRIGTSYAAYAALNELPRIERYNHQEALVQAVFGVFEDLKGLWDASDFAAKHGDASAWAYRDDLDLAQTALWDTLVLVLNDWDEVTVPPEHFMRFFYPRIRRRLDAGKPLIIATTFEPSVAGPQERYFREECVVVHVTQRGDGTG